MIGSAARTSSGRIQRRSRWRERFMAPPACHIPGRVASPSRGAQRGLEPAPEVFGILQPDGKADELARDAAGFRPLELSVMGQQREGAGQREYRAETRPFAELQ